MAFTNGDLFFCVGVLHSILGMLEGCYDLRDIEFKYFLSLKFNKNPKYDKKKLFKVCHIKISIRFPITHFVFFTWKL
jgi:hypothetical protein